MDHFKKFFHIWDLGGPMHLLYYVWSWSGKNSQYCITLVRILTTVVLVVFAGILLISGVIILKNINCEDFDELFILILKNILMEKH